jgi:hypothetical protein
MALEPPPERVYASDGLAIASIHSWAKQHGYALTIARTKCDKRSPPTTRKYYYRCGKGDKKRSEGYIRKSGTQMTECPFAMQITRQGDQSWQLEVTHPHHNHEPSADPSRPTGAERATIQALSASNIAPRDI